MRILAYPKFHLTADEQMEALDSYIPLCEAVEITKSCPAHCRNTKCQSFLDLAECGKADVLVTGDEDLLALAGVTAFHMETPQAYRRRVCGEEAKP